MQYAIVGIAKFLTMKHQAAFGNKIVLASMAW
jgi:hypothetical protein